MVLMILNMPANDPRSKTQSKPTSGDEKESISAEPLTPLNQLSKSTFEETRLCLVRNKALQVSHVKTHIHHWKCHQVFGSPLFVEVRTKKIPNQILIKSIIVCYFSLFPSLFSLYDFQTKLISVPLT